MAFISDAKKNTLGNSMVNVYNQTVNSITQVSQNKAAMNSLISAMKTNSKDYSEEDWKELQELLADVNNKISEL